MNSDGTDRQVVAPSGWGAQWSPDGKLIAYNEGGNIYVLDAATRQSKPFFVGNSATRYDSATKHLNWSHNGRYICFRGRRRDTTSFELVLLDLKSESAFNAKPGVQPKDANNVTEDQGLMVLLANAGSVNPDVTWSPDSQQVVFTMQTQTNSQLYSINLKIPGLPLAFPAQPPNHRVYECSWSRDGKSIAIINLPAPELLEWPAESITNPLPQ